MAEEIALREANTRLSELVRRVEAGEEIVIRRGARRVARLVREPSGAILAPGSVAGISGTLAEDFDAELTPWPPLPPTGVSPSIGCSPPRPAAGVGPW
ncbi:MAG: type II toxin-antitoxin system Phd/YefM family antitoxin [Sporichthyaceae bacterium]